MPIKLLIVDDHAMVREGLSRMLGEDSFVGQIDEAKNGLAAVIKAKEMQPDVIIMDYDMPHYNGIYGTKELLKESPDAKVLMLSMFQTKELILEAIQAGVKGFVLKEGNADELIGAIKAVYSGQTWYKGNVAEIIAPYLIAASTGQQQTPQKGSLSKREKEILCLFAEGLSAKEIGEKLNISKRTVEVHKSKIFKKLYIHNTAELIRYAIRNNLTKLQ
jgi:DNA-binding NarL/FixJ family response regulator